MGTLYTPFEQVLAASDVITLHCPLLPSTRHMIGAAEFAAMRRAPLLVNTARATPRVAASGELLAAVRGLTADDLVLCLMSGGASSLLTLPAEGLSLADKQRINRQLLRSGAPIDEMNAVRKHLSRIKGGRLATA